MVRFNLNNLDLDISGVFFIYILLGLNYPVTKKLLTQSYHKQKYSSECELISFVICLGLTDKKRKEIWQQIFLLIPPENHVIRGIINHHLTTVTVVYL